jgi:methionyl-tRNA synthetase
MYKYLTTPIYYASGTPHLGHAYTTLLANCYRNYHELNQNQVKLITGTDEHGQKIERTARANATSPAQFAADRSSEFRALWQTLGISIDGFVRTTDQRHKQTVLTFWDRLLKNGDIYLGQYSGLYCVDCEQYFSSGDDCPIHRKPLENLSEESYFFRLSRYQDQLIQHIQTHDNFILPQERRNEVLSLLKNNELHDLSVSRTSTDWGIPVPGDSGHVIYVWIDALVSYLSALGTTSFNEYWANTTHFIGKDILVFHGIYWPALLLAAGYPLPTSLVVNGWLTVEGRKISKSDPETIVDPVELANLVSSDGLKYYFLKGVSFGLDVNFSKEHLYQLLNADLSNNVGNLVNRFISLVASGFDGHIGVNEYQLTQEDLSLLEKVESNTARWQKGLEIGSVHIAARCFSDLSASVNAYLQHQEPWNLLKQDRQSDRVKAILLVVHSVLVSLTVLGYPFVPDTVRKIREGLCIPGTPAIDEIGKFRTSIRTRKIEPVFPRLELTPGRKPVKL